MRIIFMGTPDFAVPTLEHLIDSKHEILAVVTQPDKPKGRKKVITPPPVKVTALDAGIKVLQPVSVRDEQFISTIKELNPDMVVTCAYGKILPQHFLDIPPFGTVNVHSSLLPKYRGAGPINWAIINGESVSGVTTMYTDIGTDTGDILLAKEVEILPHMDAEQLHDILKDLGASLLIETIEKIEDGTIERIPQDEEKASYAPMLTKEIGIINWSNSARDIDCLVRGVTPWPGAFTSFNDLRVRVVKAECCDVNDIIYNANINKAAFGEVLYIDNNGIYVKTGTGVLKITRVKPDSSKEMDAKSFVNGRAVKVGDCFR